MSDDNYYAIALQILKLKSIYGDFPSPVCAGCHGNGVHASEVNGVEVCRCVKGVPYLIPNPQPGKNAHLPSEEAVRIDALPAFYQHIIESIRKRMESPLPATVDPDTHHKFQMIHLARKNCTYCHGFGYMAPYFETCVCTLTVEAIFRKREVTQRVNSAMSLIEMSIPKIHNGWTLESWSKTGDSMAMKIAKDWMREPQSIATTKKPMACNLFLEGHNGTGKSTLGVCVYQEFLRQGKSCLWLHGPVLMDKLETALRAQDGTYDRMLNAIYNSPVLIIDDPNKSRDTEWRQETFFKIISQRRNDLMPTLITANHNIKDFSGFYGNYAQALQSKMSEVYIEQEVKAYAS